MNSPAHIWQTQARRERRRINLGWWVQTAATPMIVTALVLGCAALWLRRQLPEQSLVLVQQVSIGLMAAILGITAVLSRKKFVTLDACLTRMDAQLGLHNALTVAQEGRAAWPTVIRPIPTVTRWHWPNTVIPFSAAFLFLLAGWLIPVPAPTLPKPAEAPPAWGATAAELAALAEKKIADEQSLENTRKALEALSARPVEEWYGHASLEATDRLRQKHRQAMRDMEQHLHQSMEIGRKLSPGAPPLSPANRAARADQLRQALDALKAGGLKPNKALLESLKKLDPEGLGKLTPAQVDAAMGQLQAAADALRELADNAGNANNGGNGKPGDNAAQGGQEGNGGKEASRGGGAASDVLGDTETTEQAGAAKPLRLNDLSQTKLGDLLELEDQEHENLPISPTLREGGSADAAGGGGAVWQDSLHPSEQEAIKRYFE